MNNTTMRGDNSTYQNSASCQDQGNTHFKVKSIKSKYERDSVPATVVEEANAKKRKSAAKKAAKNKTGKAGKGKKNQSTTNGSAPANGAGQATTTTTTVTQDRKNYHKMFADYAVGLNEFSARRVDETTHVMRWNNSFWEVIPKDHGMALAYKWLETRCKVNAKDSYASESWKTAKLSLMNNAAFPEPKASDATVVPMLNAYLHIAKDGQITVQEPDKKLGLTFAVPMKFKGVVGASFSPSPIPPTSLFGSFLNDSLPDPEIRALVQEQCAMTFLDTSQTQIMPWWFGEGRNGKGTMIKLLHRFHAKVASLKLHKLDDNHSLYALYNASLVIIDEVSTGKWCEETLKSCVSGDVVMLNPKGKDNFQYRPFATWIVSSNQPPFVTDKSDGTWRRIVPVEWTTNISAEKEHPNLDMDIFDQEGDAVLDWLLEGLQRILQRGHVLKDGRLPQKTRELIASLRGSSDSIRDWIESEGICYSKHVEYTKQSVYEAYRKHCEQEHGSLITENFFWKVMRGRSDMKKVMDSERKSSHGSRPRVLSIAITPMEIDQAKAALYSRSPSDAVEMVDDSIPF